MRRSIRVAIACLALLSGAEALSGCASAPKRPVLYPNAHLKKVGEPQAQQDVQECMSLAQQSGVPAKSGSQVGRSAAGGAAIGGAAGGAAGAVLGGNVLRSAGVGAAAGAAGGAVRGAFKSQETDPVFKNFVARCLSERGYEVIGWK